MANLFNTDYETPEEAQKRIVQEQLARMRSMGQQTAAGSIGQSIGRALSGMFGAEAKEMSDANRRQEAQQAGQLVQDQLEKQGMSEYEAQLKARAHTIAVLRDQGDTELANQMYEGTREYMKTHQKETDERNSRLLADEASKQSTKESKQREFLSKTEGQITADLSRINDLMAQTPEDMRGGPAYRELQRKQDTNRMRLLKLREEQENAKGWTITDIAVEGDDGEIYKQRVAVNDEDPTEMHNLGDPMPAGDIRPMTSAGEKKMMEYQSLYNTAQGNAKALGTVLDGLEHLSGAGWAAKVEEMVKDVFGMEDIETYIRTMVQDERVTQAIQNLPPGVASDKDIELVMSGTISPTASPEVQRAYLRGLQKIEQYNARYNKFAANHISNNGSAKGLLPAWDKAEEARLAEEQSTRDADVAQQQQRGVIQQEAKLQQDQILGQIQQLQQAMADPSFPPQARQQYSQQLQALAQQLQQLQQQTVEQTGGVPQSGPEADVLNDILRR
jgi:hypothetical protein